MMAQVLGSLAPKWGIRMELWTLDFGLAQIGLLLSFEERMSRWKSSLCLSLTSCLPFK